MALPNFSFLFRDANGDDSGTRRPEGGRRRERTTEAKSEESLDSRRSDAQTNEELREPRPVQADSPQRMSRRDTTNLSDGIVSRLRARDDTAYAELVERLGPELTGFAAQMVQSDEAAKDIVQDIFYQIWQQGQDFEPRSPLVAYLYAAVRNRALDVLRHDRTVQRAHDVLLASADVGVTSPESAADLQMEIAEDARRLHRALTKLTQHQRTAFALRYNQELSIAEIATVLGISEKGVERLMTRVRHLLRDHFLETNSGEG